MGDSCKFYTLNPQVEVQSDAIVHLPLKNKEGNNTKPPPKVPKPSDTQLYELYFKEENLSVLCSVQSQ